MKNKALKILFITSMLSVFSISSYAEENKQVGIFFAEPDGYNELPDILKPEYDEEQELKYHDEAVKRYEERKHEFDYTPEEREEIKKIAESIDAENDKKLYPKGTFKFSIDSNTAESLGITTDLMELCIFCNGKDCYKFLLKKDEDFSVKALVKEGKYTIGYLRDSNDISKEYSLRENSFILKGGETYEATVAPYIDPYEVHGLKKMSREELEEAHKKEIENLPEPSTKEKVKAVIGRAYLQGTLQTMIMLAIAMTVFIIHVLKLKKKSDRPIEFDS